MYPLVVKQRDPNISYRLMIQAPQVAENSERYQHIPYDAEWQDFDFYVEKTGETFYLKQEKKQEGTPVSPLSFPEGETFVVPEEKYFVMGDNRDESLDSRFWGLVPVETIKGRASFIWLSLAYRKVNNQLGGEPQYEWLGFKEGIRWRRFGTLIH